MHPANSAAVLELRNVSKAYGAIKAATGVSFQVGPTETVALVGDNGAGKSTLVKMISGTIQPTDGTLVMEGEAVAFRSPADARAHGVETVFQDLALIDQLDAAGNLFLGRELTRGGKIGQFLGLLDLREMWARTEAALKDSNLKVPSVKRPVRSMSGGQRQANAIVRTVYWGKKLLLLDEPTAALGVDESEHTLRAIERIREKQLPMIVVSHNLQHVFRISDRILVMRQGRLAAQLVTSETTPEEVVAYITGAKAA
ncbi:ATP-binding cassette domain-containing protein [Pararhodobacter sp.]|jgi:ABC-type sugar transport system ATPase subunit|uniref:ATP-binding cassette domain-containing protein n=1 Tax=Pararhodobacter sp. TaxID=2127056 RepID=UPI002FDE1D09